MTDLSVLLKQLEKLDYATFRQIEEFHLIQNVADGIDYVSDEWDHHSTLSIPDEYEEFVIQGEVQRAITAKGLHWLIETEVDGGYRAEISEIAPGYDGDYWNEKHLYLFAVGLGESSCIALLCAYLKVVEAGYDT